MLKWLGEWTGQRVIPGSNPKVGLSFLQKQCSVPIIPIIVALTIIFNSEGRMDHENSIACCHDNVTITF